MPKLEWNQLGLRTYETGVDRCVLFATQKFGVAWPGIIQIQEINAGLTVDAQYFDGRKYNTEISRSDFQLKLSAVYAPDEFAPCEGYQPLAKGLYASHQIREPFALTYRTMIGSDLDGSDHGYKIHIVYNAIAWPDPLVYRTEANPIEPTIRRWMIQTLPYHKREYVWFRSENGRDLIHQQTLHMPVSRFTVSSRTVDPQALEALERVLYGTRGTNPVLPTPAELIEIMR